MKKATTLVVAVLLALLGGCASMSKQAATYDEIDYQKINLVNHWAARNNVQVVWVNYPRRYYQNPL